MTPGEILLPVGLAIAGAALGAWGLVRWVRAELRSDAPLDARWRIATAGSAAVAFALVGWGLGFSPLLLPMVAFAFVGAGVSIVDLVERRIPNRMLLIGAVGVGALLLVQIVRAADWWSLLWVIAGAAAMFALYLLLALIAPRAMGMGDVKLAALIGGVLGVLGLDAWLVALFGAFLIGGLVAVGTLIAGRAGWRDSIPFGPWMVAGALAGIAIGA